jgi:hypothetical protein
LRPESSQVNSRAQPPHRKKLESTNATRRYTTQPAPGCHRTYSALERAECARPRPDSDSRTKCTIHAYAYVRSLQRLILACIGAENLQALGLGCKGWTRVDFAKPLKCKRLAQRHMYVESRAEIRGASTSSMLQMLPPKLADSLFQIPQRRLLTSWQLG